MAKVLLCALLESDGRILFLKKLVGEREVLCLPCVIADEKENPLEALRKILLEKTGIDAFVQQVAFSGKYNAGSRKRKQFVSALAFKAVAKKVSPRADFVWLKLDDALKKRVCRECEWMRTTAAVK